MSAKINKNAKFPLEQKFAGYLMMMIIKSRNPCGIFNSIIQKQVDSL